MGLSKSLLGGLGLLGGSAYAMIPDDAQAARPKWMADLAEAFRSGETASIEAQNLRAKHYADLKALDDRYSGDTLHFPENIVAKLRRERIINDGLEPDKLVDDINSVFFGSRSKVFGSKVPGRQVMFAPGENLSNIGFLEPRMEGGGVAISEYPITTEELWKTLGKKRPPSEGPPVPSPSHGDAERAVQRSGLSGVEDGAVNNLSSTTDAVKTLLPLGLTGSGLMAYGLASPDDAHAMYIGPKGLANLFGPDQATSMLMDAEKMAAKGVDNEAIRQATGLFQGMDGKWRWEVDDSASKALRPQYPPNFMNQAAKEAGFSDYVSIPLADRKSINARADQLKTEYVDPFSNFSAMSNHLQHDDLFRSYPELESALTRVDTKARHQGVAYQDGSIEYGGGMIGGDDRSTLLHELQHAIQQREGFARGGSPSEFTQVDDAKLARDALAFRRELDKMPRGMDSLAKENAIVKEYQDMDAMDFLPSREARDLAHDRAYNPDDQLSELVKAYGLDKHADMTPKRAYDWLAGEIEARDTAARMNLTPDQRMATPPDLRDNAIVRFNGGDAANGPQGREWAKESGNNTPNMAQSVLPSDPLTPSPQAIAAAAAIASALKAKDQPLEDTYQPADLLTAFLTGGGGLMSRGIQAALDPVASAAFDYIPRVADAINPRNIVLGLMR